MSDMKMLENLLPDKSKMIDSMGRPLTQGLFLEIGYGEFAVYTLKEQDHFYEGRLYPSLKRLYLLIADPTEYEFATTCFTSWKHWLRICENKVLKQHIEEWRLELEVLLRSQGVKQALAQAKNGSFNAAKWVADRGWEQRAAGRPSKAEKERHLAFEEKVKDEYGEDIYRLKAV